MNYDIYIQELIDVIKADTSIVQPFENYAIKAAHELLAWVHEAKMTNLKGPQGRTKNRTSLLSNPDYNALLGHATQPTGPQNMQCLCPDGGLRRDCPVHGLKG